MSSYCSIEDILKHIGGFGRFQLLALFLLLIFEIPTAFVTFIPIFSGLEPENLYCLSGTGVNETVLRPTDNDICNCTGNVSPDKSTFVSEWGLVCENKWIVHFIASLQKSGFFFGHLFMSLLSDRYGRKHTFIGSLLIMAVGQFTSGFSKTPYVYAFSRFITGIGSSGFVSISSIYGMEFLTTKWKPLCGSIGPFGEGLVLLGILSYYIRDWRKLMLITTSPFILIILVIGILPESPSWLLRKKDFKKTHKVLDYIAKINGQKLNMTKKELQDNFLAQEKLNPQIHYEISYKIFFTDPCLRRKTIYLFGLWLTWSLTFFGINYNVSNFPGDIHQNIILIGLADSLGFPSALVVNNKLGYRYSLFLSLMIATVFLVALAIFDLFADIKKYEVLAGFLLLMGKYGISMSRSSLRTLSGESYPVEVRTMGMGLVGTAVGIGGILSPQLSYLGTMYPSLPLFTFAFVNILGSLIIFFLHDNKPSQVSIKKPQENADSDITVETITTFQTRL